MGLSRLDNFLKSSRGTILYVDPNSLDATDSIENQGNSLTRPFKTIQRALIEAARFSYQKGLNNDRFGQTTILLYPGDHVVDNRPGVITDNGQYRLRSGSTTTLDPYDLNSDFNLDSASNELYKLNSIHGGVILPRGTSIVGLDLRKTKIRPKYVPNPINDSIERSAVFRLTGGCYIWQFSLFDGDPNGLVYKDYTTNTFVPNFSHHKLTCFEYADGMNDVNINDDFLTYSTTGRTDLDMYYEKVGLVYGPSSGREVAPDYPSVVDIQPKIDEYRIVGSTGKSAQIENIIAGDGSISTTDITVTLTESVDGLDVDTPFRIDGVSESEYNGKFVVSEKISDTQIKYQVQNAPINATPVVAGSTLDLSSDTVTSASPYIFNVSLRSVYGMCGLHADGSKVTGFKSMVVAQFTGIGLQKDDNAFVVFNRNNPSTGLYDDAQVSGNENLSSNSRARYKPDYRNYHVKVSNNSFIQAVSIFAIGFAEHFVTENGGDISLTNSNSNFGANALTSSGFRDVAFNQDDQGFITHIIPPREVSLEESSIEFSSIDVEKTNSVGAAGRLYLYGETNIDAPPENVIDGYRIGARVNDSLKVLISQSGSTTEYSSRIVMGDNTTSPNTSSEKVFTVDRSATGINSIGSYSIGGQSSVITFTEPHGFINGETVRVISDTGQIPDGLTNGIVAFAITTTGNSRNIKLAKTLNDAINDTPIEINNNGGVLKVVSRVSDKNSGDIGHPIQYDGNQWYISVSETSNEIYNTINTLGTVGLGNATSRTFIKRRNDTRSGLDKTYRMRYVIPANSGATARPPTEGFILQESNTSIGSTDGEIQTYFGSGEIVNINQQRNFRFIADARWDSFNETAFIQTELPHNLHEGCIVEINNIISTNNATGAANLGFNGTYSVTGVSSAKEFSLGITTNPGTFNSDVNTRNTSLPFFKRKKYHDTFYVYRLSESQKYISGVQDGIYYLSILNASNKPTVAPFTNEKFSQPVKELFPQISRDNVVSDPDAASCFATSNLIGLVESNDTRNSITRETLDKIQNEKVGIGISDIRSGTGIAHTIYTDYDHGLNRVTKLSVVSGEAGSGYGSGSGSEEFIYNARLVSIGSSVTGKHATAKLRVNGAGAIQEVIVMDGGSAYGIGNTMHVVGTQTFGTPVTASVRVDHIYDNVGDIVKVVGVKSDSYSSYNQLYRITSIINGEDDGFTVESANEISESNRSVSVGSTLTANAYLYLTGEAIRINTFSYSHTTGTATVTTFNKHGLSVDRKVRFSGADQAQYNGSFVVTKVNSQTSFEADFGVGTSSPTATGTLYAYPEGFTSNAGNITIENENLSGRMIPTYAGITTTISSGIANATVDQIVIENGVNYDINVGDYLNIGSELMRVKKPLSGSTAFVFRGVLGTKPVEHQIGSIITRVKPDAVEMRRHSIIRASGHTFEYVGFGPGNYSTAFPDKHDRAITADEELLAQSMKREGGINFYTGMNDKGISYSGNKKLSTITGREEIFDTPVQTSEGEDISKIPNLNVIEPVEGIFSRSITVDGGPDNKVISKLNGPVIVSNKLTVNSTKGVETTSLFLQGDATVSRKYTVGTTTPTLAGNPGDVVYNANPTEGGFVGWVYTVENGWKTFGAVGRSGDLNDVTFDIVGIGTTSAGPSTLKVGSGTSEFSVDGEGVGIGTTANGFNLRVNGKVSVAGTIAASIYYGDGSGLTNLNNDSRWSLEGTAIYPNNNSSVGIDTTTPRFLLEVGAVGASGTSLGVNGDLRVYGTSELNNVNVSGVLTATTFRLNGDSDDQINVGIITAQTLNVGTGGTIISSAESGYVGISSDTPTATLDVGGHTKLKTYSEAVHSGTIVANEVTLDLSEAQTFTITAIDNISSFILTNVPSGSTSFTVKIVQDSTGGRSVGIDTFKNSNGNLIPVYWPGGGVLPVVTTTADRTDIYSFKVFDGDNFTTSGLYGVVGGQNFA